jgi:proteasome lid subunit RPN8/RPN11
MPDRRLSLTDAVARAIDQHGVEIYPHECCGALVGRDGRVVATVSLPNTTEEGPRRRFLVRPSDYGLAERRAAELGGELLGFYHSHPDHPAIPSQYDLDHAWPTFAYVITSIVDGAVRDTTVWWLKDDRSSFEQGKIHHGDKNPDTDTAPALHGQEGRR